MGITVDKEDIRDYEHRFTALEIGQANIERQLSKLPDDLAAKLMPLVMTKADCEKRHESSIPWGKLLAGLVVAVTAAISAWFGVTPAKPVAGQETAQEK